MTADGYGNTVSTWAAQFEVWARRRNLVGGESVIASRLQGVQPVVLTVLRSGQTSLITTDWRGRDLASGEIFAIRAVTPTEDRKDIDILCQIGVADG